MNHDTPEAGIRLSISVPEPSAMDVWPRRLVKTFARSRTGSDALPTAAHEYVLASAGPSADLTTLAQQARLLARGPGDGELYGVRTHANELICVLPGITSWIADQPNPINWTIGYNGSEGRGFRVVIAGIVSDDVERLELATADDQLELSIENGAFVVGGLYGSMEPFPLDRLVVSREGGAREIVPLG
jgi:hypothetical protein